MVCVHMYVHVHKCVDRWRSGANAGAFSSVLKCIDWGTAAHWVRGSLMLASLTSQLALGLLSLNLSARNVGSCHICLDFRKILGIPTSCLLGWHLSPEPSFQPPNTILSRVTSSTEKLKPEWMITWSWCQWGQRISRKRTGLEDHTVPPVPWT